MTPELDFRLTDTDGYATVVHLDFRADVPLPPPVGHRGVSDDPVRVRSG